MTTIYQGDALTVLRTLPSESVQVCITSPPYFNLRDYSTATWEGGDQACDHAERELRRGVNLAQSAASTRGGAKKIADVGWLPYRDVCGKCGAVRIDQQLGLEKTPAEFISALVAVFEEVKRVLRPDGTCWVNLGDSYAGSGKGPTTATSTLGSRGGKGVLPTDKVVTRTAQLRQGFHSQVTPSDGIPAKNLLLIPERFSLAMQGFSAVPGAGLLQMADELATAREAGDWQMVEVVESQLRVWAAWSQVFDGWIVRSRIAWCKTSAMPESVTDRPTNAWEHIFMFSKSARYFYDATAVRQPHAEPGRGDGKVESLTPHTRGGTMERGPTWVPGKREYNPAGANLRNFWLLGPSPSSEAHFATFPPEIPRRCIKAGTSEKGACPACGSPWRRLVERVPATSGDVRPGRSGAYMEGGNIRADGKCPHPSDQTWRGRLNQYAKDSLTAGWQPGCACRELRCPDGCSGPVATEKACLQCDRPLVATPYLPVPCVVLDPFLGSGTTALVADQLGRDAIGIELSPVYAEMARRRIAEDAPMLTQDAVTVEHAERQVPLLLEAPS